MEIIMWVDRFRHNTRNLGYKKLVDDSILLDYGLKQEVKLLEESYALKNLSEVALFADNSNVTNLINSTYNRITAEVYFGDFGKLFYLSWKPSEIFAGNALRAKEEIDGLIRNSVWKGSILYTKKRAGFYVDILGNHYFLPSGESLNHYRVGMRSPVYFRLLGVSGYYLESLTTFLNFSGDPLKIITGSGLDLYKVAKKAYAQGNLFEYSLLEQLLIFLKHDSNAVKRIRGAKAFKRNKKYLKVGKIIKCRSLGSAELVSVSRYNKNKSMSHKLKYLNGDLLRDDFKISLGVAVRGRFYGALALYYQSYLPLLKGMVRLGKISENLGYSAEEYKSVLQYGFLRDEERLHKNFREYKRYSYLLQGGADIVVHLYLLEMYAVLLEFYLDRLETVDISLDCNTGLNVVFSRILEGTKKDKGKFTSISRRGVSELRPIV